MSQDNIEIVRRYIDVWNKRDVDAVLALLGPDFEIDLSRSRAPYRGVYQGLSEARKRWQDMWDAWEDIHLDLESGEFIEAGDYISSGSMDLWFVELARIRETEGAAPDARIPARLSRMARQGGVGRVEPAAGAVVGPPAALSSPPNDGTADALYRHDVHFDVTRTGEYTAPSELAQVVNALHNDVTLTYFYNEAGKTPALLRT